MKIPNLPCVVVFLELSLARIVSEDSQRDLVQERKHDKSSKDS